MADIDLPELYLKTEVEIEEAGRLVPVRDSALVQRAVVYVITAWNPGDARPLRAENDAADMQLLIELKSRGCRPVRAVGTDPESEHFEESWAVVGLDDHEARTIGASFGQVAVFRIADGVQTVLACTEDWSLSRPL